MKRDDHPAWAIYNQYRTSKLNEKYYSHIISNYENLNTILEIAIAVTAPTGAVSALWFWSDPVGSYIWKIFLVITAIASLIKPFLKLTDRIKTTQVCLSGYKMLTFDIRQIIEEMKEKQSYNEEIRNQYKQTTLRIRELISKEPDCKQRKNLIHKYTDEVNTELSSFKFYIPEETNA